MRRSFLTGLGALGVAGVSALTVRRTERPSAGTAAAPGATFNLKMVTTWPKKFPGLGMSAERFAANVEEASEGTIRIKVFGAGELVPALGAFDAVRRGLADMYHGAEYYWQGTSPAFNFFAAVPFGLNGAEMSAWIRYGGGQELWDALSAKHGIKPFLVGNSGVQMGGWYKHELKSLEDFKGLKVRMPGLGGEVLSRLGAAATTLAGAEIFPALQSGAIDGTEWIGPWNDLAFGFYKIAKHYYYPGFHEPGTALSLGINLDLWNRFSKSQQKIIALAAAAETERTLAEFNAENALAYQEILAMDDVQVHPFPDEVMQAIGKVSRQVIAEAAATDETTARIHESYTAFRERAVAYSKISELAFGRARLLEDGDEAS